ncbi:hypothetical protein HanIR_Chr12g0596321 [Helianthus annuus]|nr:hypothetical protein HanIR_Chr12g0596321 [Helianthus annuus]
MLKPFASCMVYLQPRGHSSGNHNRWLYTKLHQMPRRRWLPPYLPASQASTAVSFP